MTQHRVVHILGSAAEAGMAHARIVMALAQACDAQRYAVAAWFLGEDGPLVDSLRLRDVDTLVLPPSGAGDVRAALRIVRVVRAERPAIVHLHAGGRARLWPLRASPKTKVVAHLHAARGEDGTLLKLGDLLSHADAVIATSHAVAAEARAQATVVHPGVVIRAQVPPIRRDTRPIVGTVGRLEPVKGLGTLLQAASSLTRRHPELRIEMVGRGSHEALLRTSATRLGIADRVDFLGWRTDLAALHRRWRVFAQPSQHEGFGLSALEAMASGLPVVASATGGLVELVDQGRTGFLVPVGDVGALAKRLDRLLSDRALAESLGSAGRRRAAEHFGVAAMVARIEAVYERLLAS